jgi:predicted Zn-dependent protease
MVGLVKGALIGLQGVFGAVLLSCKLTAAESSAELAAAKVQSQPEAGKPEVALPILNEALKGKPDRHDLSLLRAIALERVGRLEDAVAAAKDGEEPTELEFDLDGLPARFPAAF